MPLVEPLTKKKQRSPPQAAAARVSAAATKEVDSRVSSTPPAMATSTLSRVSPKASRMIGGAPLPSLWPGVWKATMPFARYWSRASM